MSEFFDLDDYGARDQEQQAQLYGIREDQIQPEFFDGSIEALPRGVVSGSLALGRATTLAGAVAPMAYDAVFNDNNEATDWYFKNTTQRYDDARDVMTATADDLGAAGKFIEGLTSMGTQIAGGGGISGLVASTQLNTGADLIREGVDVNTAQAVGAVDAVATGVGAWLPVFGKSIGARVVGNAIANPAVGVLDRGINNTILSANGYDEAAKKYDLFDAQSMVVDAAIGALFGRFMKPTNMLDSVVGQKAGDAWRFHQSLKPSEKDAIAVAAQQKHMVVDSAPGKPVDRRVMETHSANMQEAVDALATGRQANIKELSDTDFVPRDGDMTPAQRDAEVKNILDEMDRENDVADGGDEFAFVALGADEKLLAEAIEKGKKDVQRYINAVGLQDIPHLKDINDAARKGSGIYAGTKNIEKGVATAEQLDDADALVEVNKKLGKPDVQGEKLALVDENAIGKKSENVEAKPAAAKPISKQTDPELQQLEAVLSERGDVLVPADSTVNPLTGKVEANAEPLSAAVARMSEEKTEAQSLADSVIEAANCFLRG